MALHEDRTRFRDRDPQAWSNQFPAGAAALAHPDISRFAFTIRRAVHHGDHEDLISPWRSVVDLVHVQDGGRYVFARVLISSKLRLSERYRQV